MSVISQHDKRSPDAGAPPRDSLWARPATRSIITQAIVLALLAWGAYEIIINTTANLSRLNKNFGFDFLSQSAGFDILTSLISYSSTSSYGRAMLVGFWNTILVSGLGIIFATLIGFLIGIMRLSRNPVVRGAATIYVETLRNIPLLLQIFIWYALVLKPFPPPRQAWHLFNVLFVSNRGVIMPAPHFGEGAMLALVFLAIAVLASVALRFWARSQQEKTGRQIATLLPIILMIVLAPLLGLLLSGWPLTFDIPVLAGFNFKGGMTLIPEFLALLAALSTYTASYIAEIVRAGVQSVSQGQTEASYALGLKPGQALRLVVIPQAFRVIIPPLTSQYLNLTKNSSLAVAIAYPDLVAMGGTVLNQTGKAIEVVMIWMAVYLVLSLLTSLFMNWFNSRMKLVER